MSNFRNILMAFKQIILIHYCTVEIGLIKRSEIGIIGNELVHKRNQKSVLCQSF